MNIDKVTYNKTRRGVGKGWDYRRNASPKTLIIHTTNGNKGTYFDNEARYIYYSNVISAHYLVGKRGEVVQFLDPALRAWHAGAVFDARFNNNNSIGIEVHYTPGEGAWPSAMYNSLLELSRELVKTYRITNIELVERHRYVAVPKGRKIDPSGMSDAEFFAFRSKLFTVESPKLIQYRVIVDVANVRTSPQVDPRGNDVGNLYKGDTFYSVVIKQDERGESVHGIKTWAHLTHGISRGKLVDGLGFVHTSNLTIVG